MKKSINILVLTQLASHSAENSVYALVQAMLKNKKQINIDIASRSNSNNADFFNEKSGFFQVIKATENFSYQKTADAFYKNLATAQISDYDAVFMRLPHPVADSFLRKLATTNKIFINEPLGIIKTSSKEYLLNFPDLCAPTKICHSLKDILVFVAQFPIVLKPLKGYGGKGIMKYDGDKLEIGSEILNGVNAKKELEKILEKTPYLAVRFLKNVKNGDKRILVVNGEILAASNRLPAAGNWLCNVAQGGTSSGSETTTEEDNMIAELNPALAKEGILIYGVDTLENDEGKRILSEINTLSIGGFPQAEEQTGLPVVQIAANEIINHIVQKLKS